MGRLITNAPLIRHAPLTGMWVVITKWRELPNGIIEAVEKFSVHAQMTAILRAARKADRAEQTRKRNRKAKAAAKQKASE